MSSESDSSLAQARRMIVRTIPVGLVLALFTGGLASAAPVQDDGVWITIGRDAFDMLQSEGQFSFRHQPLRVTHERRDVVLTRVSSQDLERISASNHDHFLRCSGYVVHRSAEQAMAHMEEAARAELLGGAIDYTLTMGPLVQSLAPQVQEANILSTITTLSQDFQNRYYLHPSGRDSALWIRDLWQSYAEGVDGVSVELFEHLGWTQPSVILTIEGSSLAHEVVVLGGHLDSIAPGSANPNFSGPGADDNASGIAVLSEVIRVLTTGDYKPQRTLKFMGYAAEEVGLRGSQEIADQFINDGTPVVGVLQLDMTAFNGSIEDIALLRDFTNSSLTSFVGDLIDTYQPSLLRVASTCGYACSDHAAWHNRGFPAAMAFEARVGQHNSSIHTTEDTVETVSNSAAHSAKFARLAVAFGVELGKDRSNELFVDGFETGDFGRWSVVVP